MRVYAEDPAQNFMPSPGRITYLRVPSGPNVRDDSGVYPGYTVPTVYDPMISKLSVWAPTRLEAIARMRRALSEYVVKGITTNIRYLRAILAHPEFVDGDYDTGFLPRRTRRCSGGRTRARRGRAARRGGGRLPAGRSAGSARLDPRRGPALGGTLALADARTGEPPMSARQALRHAASAERASRSRWTSRTWARASSSSRLGRASRTPWTPGCSTTARSRSSWTDARTTSSSTSPATRSRCWSDFELLTVDVADERAVRLRAGAGRVQRERQGRSSPRRCRARWCGCWWLPAPRSTEGQGLVVVEAMKMENELKSPKAGTVIEVFAKEGSTVEANAKLLTVE